MARRPRIELAGGLHHVWQRGNNRRPIFLAPPDRRFFLSLLRDVGARYRWHCLDYCLMDNHYHLVLETPECTLGSGMRDLGSRYAQWFNDRHTTGGGHLFEARFGSKPVTRDEQFAQLLRYVARNPVRAGLCRSPEQWPWSGHRGLLSGDSHSLVAIARVMSRLRSVAGPGNAYARLFDPDGPLAEVDPDLDPWKLRPSLPEIFARADPQKTLETARGEGYLLREIAAHLGVSEATISRRLKRGA